MNKKSNLNCLGLPALRSFSSFQPSPQTSPKLNRPIQGSTRASSGDPVGLCRPWMGSQYSPFLGGFGLGLAGEWGASLPPVWQTRLRRVNRLCITLSSLARQLSRSLMCLRRQGLPHGSKHHLLSVSPKCAGIDNTHRGSPNSQNHGHPSRIWPIVIGKTSDAIWGARIVSPDAPMPIYANRTLGRSSKSVMIINFNVSLFFSVFSLFFLTKYQESKQ